MRAVVSALLLCLASCGLDDGVDAALTGIQPSVVSKLARTQVTVTGTHLFGSARVSLDDTRQPELQLAWRLTVGAEQHPADEVSSLDGEHLRVVLPAMLPLGVHDVVVTTPRGQRLTLSAALEVVDRPVNLILSVEDAASGSGQVVGNRMLTPTQMLQLYAIGRDLDGRFLADVASIWTVQGGIGTATSGPAATSTFTATRSGTGVVVIEGSDGNVGRSGPLIVTGTECAAGSCGDGICCPAAGETACTCAQDCGSGICGDGCCTLSELSTCAGDCPCTAGCQNACGAAACCTQSCTGNNCNLAACNCALCRLECDKVTNCSLSCPPGKSCALDCNLVNNCNPTCGAGAACRVTCNTTTNCRPACSGAGTTCDVDCRLSNNCDTRCESGARCLVSCTTTNNCKFQKCDGGEMTCPNKEIACNRPCP